MAIKAAGSAALIQCHAVDMIRSARATAIWICFVASICYTSFPYLPETHPF